MHPIVIMTYDKSPAIGKAVEILEAAGMEVRVLSTSTAKLADFLGALAGDDTDAAAAAKEPANEPEKEKAPEPAQPEDEVKEALVSGELIKLVIVEGNTAVLHPSTVVVGARTHYTLNESQFAFWPTAVGAEPLIEGLNVDVGDKSAYVGVIISEQTETPPVLEIGRELFNELFA